MRGFDSCYSCLKIKNINSISRQIFFNTKTKKYTPYYNKFNLQLNIINQYTNKFIYNLNHNKFMKYFNDNKKQQNNYRLNVQYSVNALQSNFFTNMNLNTEKINNNYNNFTNLMSFKKTNLFFNSFYDFTYFSYLLSYFLNQFLLNKSNIHSKKASIIIAQLIDISYLSKHPVYLSPNQSSNLNIKIKLKKYLNLQNTFNITSYLKSQNITNINTINNNVVPTQVSCFRSSTLLTNELTLNYFSLLYKNTHSIIKSKQRNLMLFRNLYVKLKKLMKINLNIFKVYKTNKVNFIWQKKRLNSTLQQQKSLSFFQTFTQLKNFQKKNYKNLENQLIQHHIHPDQVNNITFQNFKLIQKPNLVSLPKYFYPNTSIINVNHSPYFLLLLLSNPNLLKIWNKNLIRLNYYNNHLLRSNSILNTNIVPHKSFNYIISKKLLSLFSTNKIREDIIPFYYHTIIRFIEHCSGKKVLIQFYPFLNQNISYDFIIRYKSWITRMKSYERRLGHKFFFEEALHLMHLSFILRDATLFSSWLKTMILRISFWKTRTIFRFLRYLFLIYFSHIFSDLNIKGLKIKLKGKISAAGNSRKRSILYRVGKTSHSELNLRVSHSNQTINTFTGVMGFQVWLFY